MGNKSLRNYQVSPTNANQLHKVTLSSNKMYKHYHPFINIVYLQKNRKIFYRI